jgi:hypothetical protein
MGVEIVADDEQHIGLRALCGKERRDCGDRDE